MAVKSTNLEKLEFIHAYHEEIAVSSRLQLGMRDTLNAHLFKKSHITLKAMCACMPKISHNAHLWIVTEFRKESLTVCVN